jgi:hypothetical protein
LQNEYKEAFMKKVIIPTILFLFVSTVVFPIDFTNTYIVVASKLYLRESPSKESKPLSKLDNGSIVTLLENTQIDDKIEDFLAPWYKVKTQDGLVGYAFSAFLNIKPKNRYCEKLIMHELTTDYILLFDPDIVSKDELEKHKRLCPYLVDNSFNLPGNSINFCPYSDSEYSFCGSRDITAWNFFRNAEINIKRNEKTLNEINENKYRKEASQLIEYYRKYHSIEVWIIKSQYKYFKTWDINILKEKYLSIDPSVIAKNEILEIEKETDKLKKYKLVTYQYHNKINAYMRSNIIDKDEMVALWSEFIKKLNIQTYKVMTMKSF